MDSVTVGADRLQTADPLRDEPERGSSLRAERPPMIDFDDRFSRRILIRLLILAIVAVALILGSLQFITQLYFENQLTMVGLAVNGAIVLLFVLGLARLVATLFRYAREERALGTFLGALDAEDENPAYEVDSRAMIVQRYHAVLRLTEHNVPVNHGALASTLMSNENTRLSFPRFVNNVLILTGVFGTIVALSIALVGASDLLDREGLGNIGLVIHGMSTALSTTLTAIVCYFFFAYFFLKSNDAKTHLLSGIEQVTSLYLLPRYTFTRDTMLVEVADLVLGLRQAAEEMRATQSGYAEAGKHLAQTATVLNNRMGHLVDDIARIKRLLKEGFRLPSADD